MKNYLLILLVCLAITTLQAQTKEAIKSSTTYYWGESSSENEKEAEDAALARLTRQIAVTVSSSYERNVNETNTSFQESVQDILKSYSSATLKNVKSMRQASGGTVDVFLYIEKSEVQKIFEERKLLIQNIYGNALDFEKEHSYADALKDYYFALLLMHSIPEQNIRFNDINLTTEIPMRINSIINGARFSLIKDTRISDTERELTFKVAINDQSANTLDFSFWDGVNQVDVKCADEQAVFRLIGPSTKFEKIDISIKYSYYECRNEITVVNELWNVVNKPSFKNTKQVSLKIKENVETVSASAEQNETAKKYAKGAIQTEEAKPTIIASGTHKLELKNNDNCPVMDKISSETEKFLSLLDKNGQQKIASLYSGDAFLKDKLNNLVKYNRFNLISGPIAADVNKTYSGWELRRIKIISNYSSLRKQAPEYAVLDFDSTGTLYDVNFGIMDNLYNEFVTQGALGNDWGNRQVIIKFFEKYRTAFLSRNIEMLDSLFSDEAVIIVGRVLSKTKAKDVYKYYKINDEQPDVAYTQYTKNEYLKNQAKLFKSQKDIYLGYNSFKILRKNKQEGVYSFSMRQNYESTSYSDEGYLFLLVDFNHSQPQIYVRAWQPQEWNDNALIKLSNYNINKLERK